MTITFTLLNDIWYINKIEKYEISSLWLYKSTHFLTLFLLPVASLSPALNNRLAVSELLQD